VQFSQYVGEWIEITWKKLMKKTIVSIVKKIIKWKVVLNERKLKSWIAIQEFEKCKYQWCKCSSKQHTSWVVLVYVFSTLISYKIKLQRTLNSIFGIGEP